MKTYELKFRLKHVILHLRCLILLNTEIFLYNQKNFIKGFKKNWFFIKGIFRAFLPL